MTVGVVPGDRVATDTLVGAIEAAGERARVGPPGSLPADSSLLVVVGEKALLALADECPSAPVLPIDAGRGVESSPAFDAADAVESALDGTDVERSHPLLAVVLDGESVGTALRDVALVTSEPARISEYAIDSGGERITSVRADGVVVATPAGSHGYAAAAGGPALEPETGVVCAVPIAPFHTHTPHWVLNDDGVSLSVLRDEDDVSLLIDGHDHGMIDPSTRVGVTTDGSIRLVGVPESTRTRP